MSAILAVCALVAAPGCFDSNTSVIKPVLTITDVEWAFLQVNGMDVVVANVTFRNVADFTPGIDSFYPLIDFVGSEIQRDTRERDHDQYMFFPGSYHHVSLSLYHDLHHNNPTPSVWFTRQDAGMLDLPNPPPYYGPISFPPGTEFTMRFGFVPRQHLTGDDEFYRIDVGLESYDVTPEGQRFAGERYVSGCFNFATPEFYGERAGRPDCPVDEDERHTHSWNTPR